MRVSDFRGCSGLRVKRSTVNGLGLGVFRDWVCLLVGSGWPFFRGPKSRRIRALRAFLAIYRSIWPPKLRQFLCGGTLNPRCEALELQGSQLSAA